MAEAPHYPDIDWPLTSWEGNRNEQLRRWRMRTVRQRFQAVGEMNRLSRRFAEMRKAREARRLPLGSKGGARHGH